MIIVKPGEQERTEWPDATRAYVEGIELRNEALTKERFETETFNNIKGCPWCYMSPTMTEVPSGKFMLSCFHKDCEVQPYTTQETKLKAILAWNRRNSSLELTADHCAYYEQELIPQLKASITNILRLARMANDTSDYEGLGKIEELRKLVKTYFEINEIGCECCTVSKCGKCMVCMILECVGEKNAKKHEE